MVIQGPSNTGKSAFIRGLRQIYQTGDVLNEHTFSFSGGLDKELIFWEEPLITDSLCETVKNVFEGADALIPVKNRGAQKLHRTPIIVTTNRDIWHFCSTHIAPLKNRIFHYHFDRIVNDKDGTSASVESADNRLFRGIGRGIAGQMWSLSPPLPVHKGGILPYGPP